MWFEVASLVWFENQIGLPFWWFRQLIGSPITPENDGTLTPLNVHLSVLQKANQKDDRTSKKPPTLSSDLGPSCRCLGAPALLTANPTPESPKDKADVDPSKCKNAGPMAKGLVVQQ